MPTEIDEGDLIFAFDNGFTPTRFDDDETHGMSHMMKSVDFLVHSHLQTWLVEVKDPDDSTIPLNRLIVKIVVQDKGASFRKHLMASINRRFSLPIDNTKTCSQNDRLVFNRVLSKRY